MRTLKTALLATAATAAFSSAALAADLVIHQPVPVIDNSYGGFDWSGPYAGVWVGGITNPEVYALGADLGVNVMIDSSLLAGVEGNLWYEQGHTWGAQVHGRLGVALDSVLLYGLAGVGVHMDPDTSTNTTFVPVGVGAEFALADNMSLKAEYNYQWDVSGGGADRHVGKFGVNFHF